MWPSTNQIMNDRNATKTNHFRKQQRNADIDLTELVAKASAAQRQIQPNVLSPMALNTSSSLSTTTTTASTFRSTMHTHKNQPQNKSKTSADIINETKNMLAHGNCVLFFLNFYSL